MVEKRVGDSPPNGQRRKKLSTHTDACVDSKDVDASCSTANHHLTETAIAPTAATCLEDLPLVFHERFQVLDLEHERIITSPKTDAQNDSWRVVWLPRSATNPTFVSIFVELLNPDFDRSRLVEVSIRLLNQLDEPSVLHHTSVHEFSATNAVYGLRQFIERSVVLNPSNAFVNELGQVEVDVQLRFVHDEATLAQATRSVASHRRAYASKSETDMVGLKNQGATCYLNSLLQTLFHLRAFRHVVYETPTTQEDTTESVSLALQRVFYRLQRQDRAVSTKELTRAFGWSAMESFMQHDVQELYRILCDRLEEKMKHTRVHGALPRLFAGNVRSFVHCVHVPFQSFRDECFYDLQLDVKGCTDLLQSFRKYVELELLEGDNQYDADGHGKQDAKKGMAFLSLPPVLNIQLKRFEYDPLRDGMVKVHDRLTFPKTLVLDEFMPPLEKEIEPNQPRYCYHLHSVLVHSGDVHGGHYYVFIRPGKDIATSTDWFKFDDDQITHVDEHVAIDGNFGSGGTPLTPQAAPAPVSPLYENSLFCSPDRKTGSTTDPTSMDGYEFRSVDTVQVAGTDHLDDEYRRPNDSGTLPPTSSSNSLVLPLGRSFASAYMLVYVRDGENDRSAIQDAQSATDSSSQDRLKMETAHPLSELPRWQTDPVPIPPELVTRFREEEQAAARRKKAQQTEHLYMNLRVASDTSVAKLKRITKTMDFAGFNNSSTVRIRIQRTASIRQLYRHVYLATGVPVSRIRLWKVITRENRTTRPDQALGPDVASCSVESLIEDDASPKAPVKLFLQIVKSASESLLPAPLSPSTSPSSPSIQVRRTPRKASSVRIYRHFLDEFLPPVQEEGTEDEDAVESVGSDCAPPLTRHDILLFIKFYDVTKELGDRLEYVGNIVVDSRMTGGELATYLCEALSIPKTRNLVLYEEVQPMTVAKIHSMATLKGSEIQSGDIICFQYAEDEAIGKEMVLKPELCVDDDPDAMEVSYIGPDGDEVKTVFLSEVDEHAVARQERYPDVPSYFQYLLDRIDIVFYCYGHAEEKSFTLPLLLSNVYDDVIDAVAAHVGLAGAQRLFVRLYQHSPINNLPMKSPLRHSRYAGDHQTTLEDLLSEYMDRTNVLYYEVLDHPITEIEAKKELIVHLSAYDTCFATEPTASPSFSATPRHVQVLVLPTDKVCDLLQLIREGFDLPPETPLRACEVVQQGTMITHVMNEDATLSRYWGSSTTSEPEILVEQIPAYEVVVHPVSKQVSGGETHIQWIYKGVVHFNYQNNSHKWIHPHGVPCIVRFHELETVGDVKERIRQRMGISSIIFAQWNLALVKDLKASTLLSIYEEMEADALDAFPMARLTELCGADFEGVGSLGLEHADPTPASRHHSNRRLETGIHIRQS